MLNIVSLQKNANKNYKKVSLHSYQNYKIKEYKKNFGSLCRNWIIQTLLVGMYNGTTTLEKIWQFLTKTSETCFLKPNMCFPQTQQLHYWVFIPEK